MDKENNSLIPKEEEIKKNKRISMIVLFFVGVAVFILTLLAYRYIGGNNSISSESVNNATNKRNFFPFLPIWFAVLIPIVASNKKEHSKKDNERIRSLLLVVMVLVALLILGMFLYLSST